MAAINDAAKVGLCDSLADAVHAMDEAGAIIFQLLYERGLYCLDFETAEGFVAAAKGVLQSEVLQHRDVLDDDDDAPATLYSRVTCLAAVLNPNRDPSQMNDCLDFLLMVLLSSYWHKAVVEHKRAEGDAE